LGKKGSGKTTWIKKNLIQFKKIIIIDTIGEYKHYGLCAENFDQFEYYLTKHYLDRRFVINIQVDEREEIDKIFNFIIRYKLENLTIIADEVQKYYSNNDFNPDFDRLINFGRHYGINIIGTSRRPSSIKKDLIANADKIILFRIQETNDLKYLKILDAAGKKEVMNLPDYEFKIIGK